MIKGININQRIEYVSKLDTSEPKTVFVLKPVSASVMMDLVSGQDGNQVTISGAKIFDFLKQTIVEIRNFGEGTVAEMIERLPTSIVGELVAEASRINTMTEQDAKN